MREKSCVLAFALIIIFVGVAVTDSSAEYVCGDADGDGSLSIGDAVFMINYIFKGGPAPDSNCCDPACPSTVADYDDNVYTTIRIGDQCWMMENLKVTHYRNGDPIPNVTDNVEWAGLTTGAYCNYDNDEGHVATYGRLYNWYAVADSRNIAPEGWHVATDDDWKELEMYLGMSQEAADAVGLRGTDEGGKLKEAETAHWWAPNTGATNESGFTALPGGYRVQNLGWDYMGRDAFFWTSTEFNDYAWYRQLNYTNSKVYRQVNYEDYGLSVRCVKD